MKKMLIFTVVMGILAFGANAFAMTTSAAKDTPGATPAGSQGGISGTSFSFDGITNSFVSSPSASLILTLSGSQGHTPFSDTLDIVLNGNTVLASNVTTHTGTYTFNFNSPATLTELNNAIANHTVTFSLLRNSGTSSISAAQLKGTMASAAQGGGTMAPEPISMALFGAGIVGLPFARRFRKALGSES